MKKPRCKVPNTITVGVVCLGIALGGCGILDPDPNPETARIRLDAVPGTTVTVVTATEFLVVTDEFERQTQVQLFEADTAVVNLPLEETFDIRNGRRFFSHIIESESESEPIQMQVWIDDGKRYDETAVLPKGVLRFVYAFNNPVYSG